MLRWPVRNRTILGKSPRLNPTSRQHIPRRERKAARERLPVDGAAQVDLVGCVGRQRAGGIGGCLIGKKPLIGVAGCIQDVQRDGRTCGGVDHRAGREAHGVAWVADDGHRRAKAIG